MFRVTGWSSFQSYRDRKPPWIRLHKSLLDSYEFQSMSVSARAILPMLWLLASEDEDPVSGLIRDRYEKIAFRLRCSPGEIRAAIDECVAAGFLESLSEEKHNVTKKVRNRNETVPPETETETETEGEGAQKPRPSRSPNGSRLPDDWTLPDEWLAWALAEEHLTADEARREAAKFADYWRGRAGAGARKLDWRATWQNWCRRVADDRGKVRQLRPEEPDRPRQRFPGTGGAP